MIADDSLTVGPEPTSKLVDQAQDIYRFSWETELGLLMIMNYHFVYGEYSESSISIFGQNQALSPVRELPNVGGTGIFRSGRGYAIIHTHQPNFATRDAIVAYNPQEKGSPNDRVCFFITGHEGSVYKFEFCCVS